MRSVDECDLLLRRLRFGLLGIALCASAQHYAFRMFGRESGLTSLGIRCLYQDRTGFVWAGTENGLFRYEGGRFTRYGVEQGLPGAVVEAVHQTADGALWAATREGLARFNGTRFEKVVLGWAYRMYGPSVIDSDAHSTLYFTTDRGLVIGRQRSPGHWDFLPVKSANPDAGKSSSAVYAASDGRTWYGCGRQLCIYDGDGIKSFGPEKGLPGNFLAWIGVTPTGSIALRSYDQLVFVDKGLAGAPQLQQVAPTNFRAGKPAFDHAGRMLVPTLAGLAIEEGNGRWRYVASAQGLIADAVSSVLEDREGSIWIGTPGYGVMRWPGYGTWETWGRHEGLSHDAMWALQYDAKGVLWACTSNGVHRFVHGKWEQWPKSGIPMSETLSLAFGADGTMWVGSYPNGLFEVDVASGKVRRHYGEAELGNAWVMSTVMDTEGRLWVSTFKGLLRSSSRGGRVSFEPQAPPGSRLGESFFECLLDRRGRVWAPGSLGLALFDHGTWRRLTVRDGLKDSRVRVVAEAPDGAIWIGYTSNVGITRLVEAGTGLQITHFTSENGLKSNNIYSLGFDKGGGLWVGTDNGVDVLRRDGWHHYSQADGLAWNDTNSHSFAAGRGEEVWVGTNRGLSHFLGGESGRESVAPQVVITSVSFGDGPPGAVSEPLEIPYRDRTLRVSYTACTFQDEQEVLFRYRITGLDEKWVTTGNRELRVPHLPSGTYRFEVLARSARGVWSRQAAAFRFRILPPWYLRWWSIVCGSLLITIAGWALYKWRVRRLMAVQNRLETMVAARTRELQDARLRAEESNRLKSEFLATMSHEIRTPMNAVLGMTNLVLAAGIGAENRENLETVKLAGESLLVLLNDILDLSKIEAGRMPLDAVPFSLRRCLDSCVQTLKVEAVRKGLDLASEISRDVPDALVGDPPRIRQIVINLLGNAVKFTDRGRVRLEVVREKTAPAGVDLRFSVSDTGIGIPRDKQAIIFEPFRQADGSTTRRYEGTGLGLAISARLVEAMGGRIAVESEPGVGSRFHFSVRFQSAPAVAPEEAAVLFAPPSEAPARRLSILLAEDNPVNQKLAARLLGKRGHDVTVVGTGREALAEVQNKEFDLVLMDVQMPEMDGLEATAVIREREKITGDRLPVIAMTANAMTGDREKCLQAGMDDYISKPFQSEELIQKVEMHAGGRLALGRR